MKEFLSLEPTVAETPASADSPWEHLFGTAQIARLHDSKMPQHSEVT